MTIHSCGYHCDKPGCIKEQRDDLVKKFIVNARKPLTEQEIYTMPEEELRAALAQPEQEPQWDEVFDAATRSYVRSASSRETLRLCFQHRTGNDQVTIGWTAQELMAFAKNIASLYTAPPQRKPLTLQEVDVIWATKTDIESVVRAVERAHGIGGEE